MTYIYDAWFKAGGDPELLREPIREWLTANATKLSASFMFQKWLNSGGEPAVVRDALRRWARVHGKSPSARYVRRAWLEAGGSSAAQNTSSASAKSPKRSHASPPPA